MKFKQFKDFVEFTLQFRETYRAIFAVREKRNENDAEHSYQLTLLAWYVSTSEKLNLNLDLVIKYALIHDLPEVYAGDRHIFDTKGRVGKEEREEKAVQEIAREFPEWMELSKLLHAYRAQKDEESRFVYALDKLLPLTNIFIDGGRTFRKDRSSLELLIENKRNKVSVHPVVEKLFWEWVIAANKKKASLFIRVREKTTFSRKPLDKTRTKSVG